MALVSQGQITINDLNDGAYAYTATVYAQQFGTPDTPTGGSFDFSTKTLTVPTDPNPSTNPSTGATIWSASIPTSSTTPTYASSFLFFTTPPSTVAAGGTWGTPVSFVVNGTNAISTQLSNDTVNIPADSAGVVATGAPYVGSGTEIRVYEGATLLNYDNVGTTKGTWTVSAAGTGITASTTKTTLGTAPLQYMKYGDHSAITADIASVTYTITGTSSTGVTFSITKSQILTKQKQGASAASFKINSSSSTFTKNAAGIINPSTGIILTTTSQNITAITAYQWQLNGVDISGATTSSYTVPTSAYASAVTNTYKCTVTGTVNGITGSTLIDTITIPLLLDGSSTSTVVLSNENSTFSGPSSGYSGITFTGGNCNVAAYIGTTQLTYDANPIVTSRVANSFSCIISPSVGMTVTATTGQTGLIYAIPAPTAMLNVETGYTDVVVTIRDASGTASTITKRINYSLSRAGVPAQYVIITGEQAFKYATGATTPITTTITLTAGLFGGLTTYEWDYWNGTSWVILSGTANTQTYSLAYNNAAFTGNTLRIRCLSGTTIYDEITIVKLYDGASGTNAISGYLTNETCTVPTSSNGTGAVFTNAGGTFRVFNGTTDVTTSCTFSTSAAVSNLTLTIVANTGVYSLSTATSWTSNTASFTLTAVYNGTTPSTTLTKVYTITKSIAGIDGGQITTSATAPTNPTVGQQWWDTVSGTMYVWYNDGTTSAWVSSSLGMTGPIGVNGNSGDSVDIVFVRSTSAPATPKPSISVPGPTVSYPSDTQWYGSVSGANTAGGLINPLWASNGFKTLSLGNYTWDVPVRIDGSAVAEVTAYIRSATTLTTAPAGGTYTFGTTPVYVAPTNWFNYIPAGTDPLYTSRAVAYTSSSNTSAVTITGWTTPVLSMQNGSPGTPASYVIVTGEQAFKYATGSATPISPTITLTAILYGTLSGFQWEYYTGTGWSTLSAPFNTSTYSLAYNNAAFTGNSLRVRCVSGSTYFDEITIVKLYDGAVGTAAVSGYLTNETVTVPSAYDGSGASLTGTSGTFRVFNGITEVTSGATPPTSYSVSPATATSGLTMSITTAGVYSLSGTWDTTTNSLTFTLSAVYSGVTLTKVYTITKSKAGTPGASGTRGIFRTYAPYGTAIWDAAADTVANNAITNMVGSGGIIVVGDEVTICSPNISAPTFVLTKYASAVGTPATTATWTARGQVIDGNLLVTGSVKASSLQASTATISGTTMTGSGAIINSTGTFAIGTSTSNITYNGTATYINGPTLSIGTSPTISGTTMTTGTSGAIINSTGTFAIGKGATTTPAVTTASNITFNGSSLYLNGPVIASGSFTSGSITGSSLSVGSSPAVSLTTMTGSGAIINSGGTFAIGTSTSNITFNGSSLYINGPVIASGLFTSGSFTSGSITGSSLTVGNAALASNATTMTTGTQGLAVNSAGGFTMGNTGTNITYNGIKLYLNGEVVTTGNVASNQITENTIFPIPAQYLTTSTVASASPITTLLTGNLYSIPSVNVATKRIVTVSLQISNFDATPGWLALYIGSTSHLLDVPTRQVSGSNESFASITIGVDVPANITTIGDIAIATSNAASGSIWNTAPKIEGSIIFMTGKR